jgi:hypothetical protein
MALDNRFVSDHRIESRRSAQIHFIESIVKTNVSSPGFRAQAFTQTSGQDRLLLPSVGAAAQGAPH